jgi:hypothetical protein
VRYTATGKMRSLHLGVGGGLALVAAGGFAAWWHFTPHALGLSEPRLVFVSGEVTLDARHARAAEELATGESLRVGSLGSACFSVHASRVCIGAGNQAHIAELGPQSARIEAGRGTLIVRATGDDLRVTLPDGTVEVREGLTSIESGPGDTVVRALEGNASLEAGGRPAVVVSSPSAVAMRDGSPRPAAPAVEHEERQAAQLASRWQGSAGAILQIGPLRGRVEIDGQDAGRAPLAVLLDEGEHTIVVRDGVRELSRETLRIGAGQTVVRGE